MFASFFSICLITLPSALGGDFEVNTGLCTTSGSCIYSPNYPSNYGNSQTCKITVKSALSDDILRSQAFNTEWNYDKLTVAGKTFSGTTGPSGITMAVDDIISWRTDSGSVKSGFHVCLIKTCAQTTGSVSNVGECQCGTKLCTASTGFFCTSSLNQCEQGTACSNTGDSVANSGACKCGDSGMLYVVCAWQ